ncbi:MAG TPA: MOSC domain-containing protein [Burkholderiales bacterium]|nr:MOSC domain-containing protein [Burkholderiales bacterium]
MNPDSELAKLMSRFPRPGRVEWIGVRPGRRQMLIAVSSVEASEGRGLEGDRYSGGGKRQVTLIQAEHLDVVAKLLGLSTLEPGRVRRNIVVSGINLYALRDRRFRVGATLLEGSGTCDPCSRMEEALGPGGYNAMRGHGGITARIVEDGVISVGDLLVAV